ncbi:MAG: hypothetical protein ACFFG0_02385 [Candidatus Thorarchaeota archaeon]
MIKEITLCDCCEKSTDDVYNEVGWIVIEGDYYNIFITGGRKSDRISNIFRYIQQNKILHFCGYKCLLEFIFLKGSYFNNSVYKTLEEKLESIDNIGTKNELTSITHRIKKIIE